MPRKYKAKPKVGFVSLQKKPELDMKSLVRENIKQIQKELESTNYMILSYSNSAALMDNKIRFKK